MAEDASCEDIETVNGVQTLRMAVVVNYSFLLVPVLRFLDRWSELIKRKELTVFKFTFVFPIDNGEEFPCLLLEVPWR